MIIYFFLRPPDVCEEEDCDQEWEAAYEKCREQLGRLNPDKGITGGYTNIHDCARGLISERCGGNAVNY